VAGITLLAGIHPTHLSLHLKLASSEKSKYGRTENGKVVNPNHDSDKNGKENTHVAAGTENGPWNFFY
jgi:hypothetical protein